MSLEKSELGALKKMHFWLVDQIHFYLSKIELCSIKHSLQ